MANSRVCERTICSAVMVGKQIGVQMEGPQELASKVSIHFSSDLSPWLRDPEVLIRWLLHLDIGDQISGVLVPMGSDHWEPQSEEWVFHLQFLHGDPRVLDDIAVMEQMRRMLLIHDFHPEIHLMSRLEMEGIVASRLRVGNVFLLGDSAHRHPPTGGLGLNTAVGDVYNLCWNIAQAIGINLFSGDWLDTRFDWLLQREASSEGAVLVWPDRQIAWRSFGASGNPRATLEETLGQVLDTQQVILR